MALSLTPQDLIIDETGTVPNDDNVDATIAPHSTDTTLQYMVTLAEAGSGLSEPVVAFQADFVSVSADAGETITSVVLAKDGTGAAFSTTDGVLTALKTLDGSYVWLFKDPNNASVVIGVIGTTNAADEPDLSLSYSVAFSLALINTNTATPDLYAVQYVPLSTPINPNPDERTDLTNLVYAAAIGTTTANFSKLSDAPPGHNNWYILDADAGGPLKILVTAHDGASQAEVNVSTQGLGVSSQDVRFGRELQIDLISGGTQSAGKNFTNTPLAPDYGTHVETITSAGFTVSQSTPTNTTADIEIHAYNNNDNVEGAGFPTDDNDAEIEIIGVTFKLNGVPKTAAQLGITIDDSGTGLILHNVGEGVTVDFTTAGGTNGTFDRFTIKNIDTDKDYFDVKEVHYSGGSTTPGFGEVGSFINFDDDGPTITAPFDADPDTEGNQTPETLANSPGATADGIFAYDLGADQHSAAYYLGGGSDFVDANADPLDGVQISLTGTVDNDQNPGITDAVATLTSEDADTATFSFSFKYDKDPVTDAVQQATAAGTLVFDKDAGTYTLTLNDVIDGFSFDVLHTSELIAKAPTGNTGHPKIVVEQLTPTGDDNPFFVQFTANSVTQQIGFGFNATGDGGANAGDTTFDGDDHDLVSNTNEDWVSATRDTNGVAGDTIQKGEVLTLRFFDTNILSDVNPKAPGGGTEQVDPTALASGVVVKFDGIGNSEDLVVILDLKAADGTEITRAINVENSDLIKGNANIPAPYSSEFTLDNNDALLIIEQNDYTAAGETYQIQGIQIMQSSNGLEGTAIDLDGTTGETGGSSVATEDLTDWDALDQDVLKIVDIGFVQQSSGTISASLDFGFKLADADGDQTATQHILVDVGTSSSSSSTLAAPLSSFAATSGTIGDGGTAQASLFSSTGASDPFNHHYLMFDYLF